MKNKPTLGNFLVTFHLVCVSEFSSVSCCSPDGQLHLNILASLLETDRPVEALNAESTLKK